jgi:hypothetical protein
MTLLHGKARLLAMPPEIIALIEKPHLLIHNETLTRAMACAELARSES